MIFSCPTTSAHVRGRCFSVKERRNRLEPAMTILLISRVVVSGLVRLPPNRSAFLLPTFAALSALFPACFLPLSALFPACFRPVSGLLPRCFAAVFRCLYKGERSSSPKFEPHPPASTTGPSGA